MLSFGDVPGSTGVPTPEELICQLFDDTGLGHAIEKGTVAADLGDDVAAALGELEKAIKTLDLSLDPANFVNSTGMASVRRSASRVLSKLSLDGKSRP